MSSFKLKSSKWCQGENCQIWFPSICAKIDLEVNWPVITPWHKYRGITFSGVKEFLLVAKSFSWQILKTKAKPSMAKFYYSNSYIKQVVKLWVVEEVICWNNFSFFLSCNMLHISSFLVSFFLCIFLSFNCSLEVKMFRELSRKPIRSFSFLVCTLLSLNVIKFFSRMLFYEIVRISHLHR